jgi:hypothetical protein
MLHIVLLTKHNFLGQMLAKDELVDMGVLCEILLR